MLQKTSYTNTTDAGENLDHLISGSAAAAESSAHHHETSHSRKQRLQQSPLSRLLWCGLLLGYFHSVRHSHTFQKGYVFCNHTNKAEEDCVHLEAALCDMLPILHVAFNVIFVQRIDVEERREAGSQQ